MIEAMVHLSQTPHGGLAIGVGVFGSAVWARREPYVITADNDGIQVVAIRHRWSFWRTRAPKDVAANGDEGSGTAGVREPRRPLPGGLSGGSALQPPSNG
jgi:hypothetical protein